MTTRASAGSPRLPATRRQGELVASKYVLERPLAQGGMGSLWVARHVELDVEVAIKFSAMERGDAHDLRFRREARATARLKSPYIVHVFDYGIERDEPYIAMELLEGQTLRELLEREVRVPLARAATLVADVAKGLVVAHEAGIVHRDLKPSNLFLARVGNEQVVKILDFGIAKASAEVASETSGGPSNLGGEATRVGAIVGSPAYMSPEQARGELVDKRSDVWSLAVVTFRMLTGSEPFLATSAAETLDKICIVGRAGQKLDDIIRAMGFARGDVYIANVLKSRPPENRTPLPNEIECCAPFLAEQIRIIQPQVLVALGGPAAKLLLRTDMGITRLRGQWGWYEHEELRLPVMPTFHPAYLLRNYTPQTRQQVWADMQAVLTRLKG